MAITAFEVLAKLGLDTSGYEDDLNGALKDTESKVSGGFGKALGTAGKVIAGATTVAATAVGTLATQSVNAYADFEQLEGGIETLFGDAAPKVMANAEKAFQSAGQSMNQYMDTSIQSAAALINSLEGDQAKAADLMDMSIVDMADNVNKMGTSMEGVQNAYRGFSRGNFTMLDNLALGFAGTKEGMQQLLDKAHELSGVDYNIDSYADIVQAIHVVQEEMGVAGTTMKEGTETISGSIAQLGSAWQNLVAGFGKEDANLDQLIGSVVDAAETVLNNVQPILEKALSGIGDFISKAAPIIGKELPNIIQSALPSLLTAGTNLVMALTEGLVQGLPQLASSLMEVITNIGNTIGDALPALIPMIAEAITGIVEALTNPEALTGLMEAGVSILQGIIEGLIAAIPVFVEALPTIIQNLMTALQEGLPMIIEALITLVTMIAEQLPTIITSILEMLPTIIDMVVQTLISLMPVLVEGSIQLFMGIAQAIPQALPAIIAQLPTLISSIVDGLTTLLPQMAEAGIELFVALVENLPDAIVQIVEQLPEIITAIVKGLIDALPKLVECGVNLMKGLAEGLVKGAGATLKAVAKVGKSIVGAFKKLFKINSPSKLFEQFGQYLDEGMAIGISGNVDKVSNAMNELRDATSSIEDDLGDEWSTTSLTSSNGNMGAPGASQQQITAILELDRVQLGKAIFTLNNEETQRIGLNLANGGY